MFISHTKLLLLALVLKAREMFFDMSKPFDKVWQELLIFKRKSVGVSDSLLSLIECFLSNRSQKVLLNRRLNGYQLRQVRRKATFFSFLIDINVLSDNLLSIEKLFADNTSLFSVLSDSEILGNELIRIHKK